MQRTALFLVALGLVAVAVNAQPYTCNMIQCTVDSDCDQGDNGCTSCIGGVCGSGCQGNCTENRNCRDSNCQFCWENYCGSSPNLGCGQPCGVNEDCNQRPSNPCQLCDNVTKVCTAGCGQGCTTDQQCVGGHGCNKCVLNKCVKDTAQCGSQCTTNLDCDQTSFCSLCVNGACGAGCSQPCSNSTQCLEHSCNHCKTLGTNPIGVCASSTAKTCGAHCGTDLDCDATPGRCNQCYFNQCYSTCQNPCVTNADCGVQGCTNCVGGKCQYNQ